MAKRSVGRRESVSPAFHATRGPGEVRSEPCGTITAFTRPVLRFVFARHTTSAVAVRSRPASIAHTVGNACTPDSRVRVLRTRKTHGCVVCRVRVRLTIRAYGQPGTGGDCTARTGSAWRGPIQRLVLSRLTRNASTVRSRPARIAHTVSNRTTTRSCSV